MKWPVRSVICHASSRGDFSGSASAASTTRARSRSGIQFTPIALPTGKRTYQFEAKLALGQVTSLVRQNHVNVPDGICTLLQVSFRVVTIVKRAA